MANIADYVSQLQTLTQKNLEILTAINESFFTKREHLQVQVGSTQYVLPSFISLENKINALQDNFENLINAPKTGEAIFNIDGNSRQIELKGYTNTPHKITIDSSKIKGFGVEHNDVFKDFLTPNPYLRIDLSGIANDISHVNVRKIAFISDTLKSVISDIIIENHAIINSYNWADLYKIISIYTEDVDYVMYDTLRQLPIRKNMGYGTYTIKSIDDDVIDDNLDEIITLTLHDELKYTLYDEVIEEYLKVGDQLVTYDDSAKLEITYIDSSSKQIKVRVINGDYLNLSADPENTLSSDNCKLRFFSDVNYDANKYIDVPLEEDQYIAVFVAPTNDRMNIQAPWGGGLIMDTSQITLDGDSSINFAQYYNNNVRNIGDILNEISMTVSSTITKYSQSEFEEFTSYKPIIDPEKLKVLQINTHLNNSPTVQNIRSLYSQKQNYNNLLSEVNEQITTLTNILAEISFTDTTGVRSAYEAQLTQYNTLRNEYINSISKLSNEIATAANDSVLPIENAKYHIRGYYNWHITDAEIDNILATYHNHIKGIRVQYRYKNIDETTGTATSIDSDFLFSDWNDMKSFDLSHEPLFKDGGYQFGYPQYQDNDNTSSHDNGRLNEPSFNQIDIPISQGEVVDIRLKIVWDFGAPFIETTSNWSDIISVSFPEEYLKDVQITDIIDENNADIDDNKFKNILQNQGISTHIADSIVDQNETYYHQPDHISSGFYTAERRIIPLRDKLIEFNSAIAELKDLILNTNNTNLSVSIFVNGIENTLNMGKTNSIILPAYANTGVEKDGLYTMQATIQIANTSTHTAYLYSVMPSNVTSEIKQSTPSKYGGTDNKAYIKTNNDASNNGKGIWYGYQGMTEGDFKMQKTNQWATFRIEHPYDGSALYYDRHNNNESGFDPTKLSWDKPINIDTMQTVINNDVVIYPYLSEEYAMTIENANLYSYLSLAPGEAVIIPLMIHYKIEEDTTIKKTIAFDLRPSIYMDPTSYIIEFSASKNDTIQDKTARAESSRLLSRSTNGDSSVAKYQTIIKN